MKKPLALSGENVTLCVSGEVANEPVEYLSRRFSVGSAKKDGWCKSISCGHFPNIFYFLRCFKPYALVVESYYTNTCRISEVPVNRGM